MSLRRALDVAAKTGWSVFPVSVVFRSGGKADKKPLCKWTVQSSANPEAIRDLWKSNTEAGIGVPTGQKNKIYVVDVDDPEAVTKEGIDLSSGRAVKTRREGGEHYYYGPPTDGKTVPNSADGGLDVRGDGGYVVLWGDPPDKVLNPLPQDIADWARSRKKEVKEAIELPDVINEGARETVFVSLAGTMRKRGMTEDSILAALQVENKKRCNPPLELEDLVRIAHSVMRYEQSTDTSLVLAALKKNKEPPKETTTSEDSELTQYQMAKYCAQELDNKVLWVQKKDSWMIYDETMGIWVPEEKEEVGALVADFIEPLKPDFTYGWSQSVRGHMKHLMAEQDNVWDRYPWLLPVQNGVVDLENYKLLEASPDFRFTKSAPVPWNTKATCENWERHLYNLFEGDTERIDWFQRALGMSLVGKAQDKDNVIVVILGEPGSGKGSAIRAVLAALGQNHHAVSMRSTDLVADMGRHLQWLTRLNGARLAFLEELPEKRLDVQQLKTLSGGDAITANMMRQNDITWEPTHTFFLTTNNIPKFDGDTLGLVRRLRPIHTRGSMKDAEMDTGHDALLQAEADGILAWMIEGCALWQEDGYKLPLIEEVKIQRDIILDANDPWLEWSDDCLVFTGNKEDFASRTSITHSINRWNASRALPSLSATQLSRLYDYLAKRTTIVKTGGNRGFRGLIIKS